MNNLKLTRKRIVVVGGGFAGLNFVEKLSNDNYYSITLIDRNNYNFFVPLIYQVATGFLETSNISYPFRKLFRRSRNVRFRLGTLLKVDAENHTCHLDNGEVPYDYLIFATGSETNFFSNVNIAMNAIPMKTLDDALNMRNRLLQSIEQACIVKEKMAQRKLLTIVVAGGGPTGVEIAGVMAELRKFIIKKDYPELVSSMGDIHLIEGSSRLLVSMSKKSHREAYSALRSLGVKITLNAFVKDFHDDKVILSNGTTIQSKNLIWAAGVTAKTYDGIPPTSIGRGNRILVDEHNCVKGSHDIFAIGDGCLQLSDPEFPDGHPQLAQVAIQQGRNLASNFIALADGKPWKVFRYSDKGSLAIIGRNRAVADIIHPSFHVGGFPALLIWLFVHLTSLISYNNKAKTLYNWIAAYFTRDQSLRMIIRPDKINKKNPEKVVEEMPL